MFKKDFFASQEDAYKALIKVSETFFDSQKEITMFSNASALLNSYMEDINWVGFYFYEDGKLFLGPFQGEPACTEIKIGKGVCSACYEKKETIIVPDVSKFKGHIACSSVSKSEICIPIKLPSFYGLLDIDSPSLDRFHEMDKQYLEKFIEIFQKKIQEQK